MQTHTITVQAPPEKHSNEANGQGHLRKMDVWSLQTPFRHPWGPSRSLQTPPFRHPWGPSQSSCGYSMEAANKYNLTSSWEILPQSCLVSSGIVSVFCRNEGSPCYPIIPTPPTYHQLPILFPKLKTVMRGTKLKAVSLTQQTVTRDYTEWY
jgi:hypothetical protein